MPLKHGKIKGGVALVKGLPSSLDMNRGYSTPNKSWGDVFYRPLCYIKICWVAFTHPKDRHVWHHEVTSKAHHLSLRVQLPITTQNQTQHLLRKKAPLLLKHTKDHLFLMNVPVAEEHSTILATYFCFGCMSDQYIIKYLRFININTNWEK